MEGLNPILVDESRPPPSTRLDRLAGEWRGAPRRWGHPLHSLCSYFAMFPPQVPRVFIEWLTNPGDVVYDPFSGRGTAPMEACRLGRVGLGSDANPLAYVLTGAKVDPPDLAEVTRRLQVLRDTIPAHPDRVPRDIAMLYAPRVQRQLSWLRQNLAMDDRVDRFILAGLLGIMHANYEPGSPPRGLSISMPNTFSMSPTYVRNYIAEHKLRPPKVDTFELLSKKLARMAVPGPQGRRGRAWVADARTPVPIADGRVRLVFTSPPYLGVIQYGKYNWIRLWMLGKTPKEVDASLTATASLGRYLTFMTDVLAGLRARVADDGFVCLVIGDVKDNSNAIVNLAETVWRYAAKPAGWRRLGLLNDRVPLDHKVSRIWGRDRRGNATKVDRILILASPGTEHRLPAMPRTAFAWEAAHDWATHSGGTL